MEKQIVEPHNICQSEAVLGEKDHFPNEGKRVAIKLNFPQLLRNSNQTLPLYDKLPIYDKLLIPKVQRDYAQGRSDSHATDVRTHFLEAIFNGSVKNLEFIFGTCAKKEGCVCFIPLDGQQRLTTLFLLYLYDCKVNGNTAYSDILTKFSYDTRRAAKDFCEAITNKKNIWERGEKPSKSIKNAIWFMDYWQFDPTVSSMLNMLDAISDRAMKSKKYPELDDINFYFFDMDSFNLNENLYLKMNSRGKPLSVFENLKASIESLLEEKINGESLLSPNVLSFSGMNDQTSSNSFAEKWKFYIDRDWTEWFWKNKSENSFQIDKEFAQFLCRFLAGYERIYLDTKRTNKDIEDSLCLEIKDDTFVSFSFVKKALTNQAFEAIATVLNGFCSNWVDQTKSNFGTLISKIDEYKSLSVIQGYLIGLERNDLEQWLRFSWNMAENYVKGAENYLIFCGWLRNYRESKDKTLYETLAISYSDEEIKNLNIQLKEEIAKAKQILNPKEGSVLPAPPEDWEAAIIEAEKCAFFKGAIRFLFTNAAGEMDDWGNFRTKFKNANEYFILEGIKPIHQVGFIKSFIKSFDSWEQLKEREVFKSDAKAWSEFLLNNDFKSCVHELLLNGYENIEYNNNFCRNQPAENNIRRDICDTPLLKELVEKNSEYRLRRKESFLSLFKKGAWSGEISLDWWWNNPDGSKNGNRRLQIIQSLPVSIKNKPVQDTNFYYGIDIDFEYNVNGKEYIFKWYRNNFIYLTDDSFKLKDKDKSSSNETDRWFCFNAENLESEEIIKSMNKLVEDAYPTL